MMMGSREDSLPLENGLCDQAAAEGAPSLALHVGGHCFLER